MVCGQRLWRRLFGTKPMRILLLGLDSAGKTTILYKLMSKTEQTVPTIGFNVESIKLTSNVEFLIFDVSGQDRLRNFWRHYYHGTTGIVFVVDSSDQQRLPLAKQELHNLLREQELQHAIILIIANKNDLPQALNTTQLAIELDLKQLQQNHLIHVQSASAQQNKGLKEGMLWLSQAMKKQSESDENNSPSTGISQTQQNHDLSITSQQSPQTSSLR